MEVDPNVAMVNASMSFFIACQRGHLDMNALLSTEGVDRATPFFMACWKGHLDIVNALLSTKRVDPDRSSTTVPQCLCARASTASTYSKSAE